MLTNRREFLKQTTAVAAGTLLLPSFLKGKGVPNYQGNQLVVIQLSGGNDGLNTIIPYRNDLLYKLRPGLMSPQTEILKLDDETGLNKVMGGLRNLYNEGDISLINNVGY
ncbi:MAG: twin-arginine translocation signal domain-containing protein, partial [Marinoscillum sp.]